MSIIVPMLRSKWKLDHKATHDLLHLSTIGLAGYMAANGIADKLVKKAASGEPLFRPSRFVSNSVNNALEKIDETGS